MTCMCIQLQLAEIEEMRQREANMTALAAIGPRKQRRIDTPSSTVIQQSSYLLTHPHTYTQTHSFHCHFSRCCCFLVS